MAPTTTNPSPSAAAAEALYEALTTGDHHGAVVAAGDLGSTPEAVALLCDMARRGNDRWGLALPVALRLAGQSDADVKAAWRAHVTAAGVDFWTSENFCVRDFGSHLRVHLLRSPSRRISEPAIWDGALAKWMRDRVSKFMTDDCPVRDILAIDREIRHQLREPDLDLQVTTAGRLICRYPAATGTLFQVHAQEEAGADVAPSP